MVDGFVIDLVQTYALVHGDVHETREGVCRLGSPLARRLAQWGPGMRERLQVHARALINLLVDREASAPGRKRSAVIAGKGGKRRVAARAQG